MSQADAKWWHVADREVEALVAKMGNDLQEDYDDTAGRGAPSCVTAPSRPPRPRMAQSPRPPMAPEAPLVTPRVAASSPRPHVVPGAPLMPQRSMQSSPTPRGRSRQCSPSPRSRPASARRSSVSGQHEGNITVYIYNMHSADKLVLRVHPELRIGPHANRFGARDGEDGSCPSPRAAECRSDETTKISAREASSSTDFKTEIAQALAIDVGQIRLMHRGAPMGCEEKTLRSYGVVDGDTVQLRVQRSSSIGSRDGVVLACAAKKDGRDAFWEQDEMLCMRPYAVQSPSVKNRIDQRCAQHGAAMMPKWVSQENPKLFAPVGIGLDGHGGCSPFEDFRDKPIWTPPVDHPNQRGMNQYGLQRVREALVANRGSRGGA